METQNTKSVTTATLNTAEQLLEVVENFVQPLKVLAILDDLIDIVEDGRDTFEVDGAAVKPFAVAEDAARAALIAARLIHAYRLAVVNRPAVLPTLIGRRILALDEARLGQL